MRHELTLRRRIAASLARAWGETATVRAIILAGSAGTGNADQYSDIELDVFWSEAPTENQRHSHAAAVGASVVELHPLEEREWSDVLQLGELRVDVSHLLLSTVDQHLRDVLERGSTEVGKQLLMSHLVEGSLLVDEDGRGSQWKNRLTQYPEVLVRRTLEENLGPDRLWSQRKTLIARKDLVCLQLLKTESVRRILGVLSCINGIYLSHPSYKWSRELVSRMAHHPPDLISRMERVFRPDDAAAFAELESLALDCCRLVEMRLPEFDTADAKQAWSSEHAAVGARDLETTLSRIKAV